MYQAMGVSALLAQISDGADKVLEHGIVGVTQSERHGTVPRSDPLKGLADADHGPYEPVRVEGSGKADEQQECYQRNRQKDKKVNDGGELLKYPEQERVEHEDEDEKEDEPRLGSCRAEDLFAPCELVSSGCWRHSIPR